MLDHTFVLQVFLSFLVGGLYIGTMVHLSEQFGSKLGGLLIGMPSIVLIGLVFIAITQDQTAVLTAAKIMPATIAASSVFLMSFMLFYRDSWLAAYAGAILIWFALNLPWTVLKHHDIWQSILVSCILLSISMTFFRRLPHRTLPAGRLNRNTFLFRVIFSGSLIALAVSVAKLIGPTWGGLFASFPAAFSATIILLVRDHGIDFAASTSRAMVNGNLANVVFVIAVSLLVPSAGVALGMLLAYLICLLFAIFSYRYIMTRL